MGYEPKMKIGDQVMIHVDPLTQQSQEGMAELVGFLNAAGGLEMWLVNFHDSPGFLYRRFIKVKGRKDEYSPYRFPGDWGPTTDPFCVPGSGDTGGAANH